MIGDAEVIENVVDVRARDGTRSGKLSVADFTEMILKEYPPNVP